MTGEIASISVEQYGNVAGHVALEEDFPIPLAPKKDDRSAQEILDSVIVSLGGMAGEEVFLGKRYCGSRSDLSNAIESIYQVLANGALGFEHLPSFDVDRFSATRGIRASIPNDSSSELRSQKFVQILNEKLATAKQLVSKWETLGRIIFPILKDKESLTSEELSTIVSDYRKEHPDEIRA